MPPRRQAGENMIQLKNLRKVYKSLHGGDCIALKDINLTLPDKGMVFIIGKSGSGKSTMLNLLGGLDTITSGDIVIDGNSVASFERSDFEDYRSSYVGFIFQHYYLLEELTVLENVEMAMAIVGRSDRKYANELLARVGLEGYGGRYPRELSGGQQQRVAIARALAKNPKLILGDELTGNLDHKTSVDILTVLKEISKEKLVVVVSHNLDEADMFADRIIELHDGGVMRDRIRVKNAQKTFYTKGGVAYLPYFRDLTTDEIRELERGLKKGTIRDIVQQDDGFAKNTENVNSDRHIAITSSDFVKKNKRKYTRIFVRKGFFSKLVAIVMMTLMLLCTSVFSSIHKIDHSEVDYDASHDYVSVIKGDLEPINAGLFSGLYHSLPDDIYKEACELNGGKVYKLLNAALSTLNVNGATYITEQTDISRNIQRFYAQRTYGTLICDEEFLINEYGVDGELQVLAGDIYGGSSYGVIVTDYVADAILYYTKLEIYDYDDVITGSGGRIKAVIGTGYLEKYADIKARYDALPNDTAYADLYVELCDTEHFRDYLRELVYSLGISYTFDQNFKENYTKIAYAGKSFINFVEYEKDGEIYGGDQKLTLTFNRENLRSDKPEDRTDEGEFKMSYSSYNTIFGTSYSLQNYETFEPHDVTLRIYDRKLGERVLLYERTFRIAALTEQGDTLVSDSDYAEIRDYSLYYIGMYLENNDNLETTLAALAEHDIAPKTIAFDSIAGINKIMAVFIPLFRLIGGGMYIFIVMYLVNYAMNSIKKNYFQIGVMRSFGAKSRDVGRIFITGAVLTGVAIAVLSLVLEPFIVGLYNDLLVESFALVLDTYTFDLDVVNMPAYVPILNAGLVVVITMLSALMALLMLRRLKPIEIIRAKDNGGEVS